MVKRTLVSLILLPVGLIFIKLGGIYYVGLILLILGLAAWEYVNLFRVAGHQPAGEVVVGGVILLTVGRAVTGFESAPWMISLSIMVAMTYHLISFERGRDQAGTDFLVTIGGIIYLGWLGPYLLSVRFLDDGLWWLLIVLPAVWLADSGAYLIGSRIGRHKMSPRLSPKKSWEGYIGGIIASIIGTALLAALWRIGAGPESAITPLRGAIMGLILSVLPTLGDLGVSMLKRQVGVKDTGNLLPGHGGAFDRIDTWTWAAVIGYYVIIWLF